MDVRQSIRYLFEDEFAIALFEAASLLDQLQEVPAPSVLHHHQQVLTTLEYFQKPDDIRVLYLFEQIDLLENLPLRELILHVALLNSLDGYTPPRQFVHPQCDLAKRPLAYQLYKLVELKRCSREFIVFCYIVLDVRYQLVSLL